MATPILKLKTLKAFPAAVGGGAISVGGRGKTVGIVNTLDYTSPSVYNAQNGAKEAFYEGGLGSLIEDDNVGYIVFNVSGNTHLPMGSLDPVVNGGVRYSGIKNKSILGQTAPYGGITVTGGTFTFVDGGNDDTQDIIFRYFRSRPVLSKFGLTPSVALEYDFGGTNLGDDSYTWSFLFIGGRNIIIDHCSASFSYDKNMGGFIFENTESMSNWSFSNNMSADGSTNMYFEINDGRPTGTQNIPNNISAINNVLAYANRTPNMSFGGYGEIINNIIHDASGKFTTSFWNVKLNQINNYYGGYTQYYTSTAHPRNRITNTGTSSTEPDSKPEIYTNGNYFITESTGGLTPTVILDGNPANNDRVLWSNYIDGFAGNPPPFGGQPQFFTNTKHTNTVTHKYNEVTALESFDRLVTSSDVGAYKYIQDNGQVGEYRDSFDTDRLSEVAANNISYVAKQADNWALPTIPSNTRPVDFYGDVAGIPESFCITHGITSAHQIINTYEFDDFTLDNSLAQYPAIEVYANMVDYDAMFNGFVSPDSSWEIITEPIPPTPIEGEEFRSKRFLARRTKWL